MPNVSNVIKSIQDIMRKDAGTYGDAQRLEQLGLPAVAVLQDGAQLPQTKSETSFVGEHVERSEFGMGEYLRVQGDLLVNKTAHACAGVGLKTALT